MEENDNIQNTEVADFSNFGSAETPEAQEGIPIPPVQDGIAESPAEILPAPDGEVNSSNSKKKYMIALAVAFAAILGFLAYLTLIKAPAPKNLPANFGAPALQKPAGIK